MQLKIEIKIALKNEDCRIEGFNLNRATYSCGLMSYNVSYNVLFSFLQFLFIIICKIL